MPSFGLGNFMYDMHVDGNAAKFKFYDPEDVTNTAETSVSSKEIPEDSKWDVDGREVSEIAYSKVAKELNDKRDKRIREEQIKALDDRQTEDARAREAAVDFQANAQDTVVQPIKTEKDGTKVYNAAPDGETKKKS